MLQPVHRQLLNGAPDRQEPLSCACSSQECGVALSQMSDWVGCSLHDRGRVRNAPEMTNLLVPIHASQLVEEWTCGQDFKFISLKYGDLEMDIIAGSGS
jgi:hypothetical protein